MYCFKEGREKWFQISYEVFGIIVENMSIGKYVSIYLNTKTKNHPPVQQR